MDASSLTPDLLAAGDGKSAALDPAHFAWVRICTASDPDFAVAFDALWAEFGASYEMETREVIGARFATGSAMRYEIILVRSGGEIAAVRDHTILWIDGEALVHLSHVLVAPEWRRSGLAGWMRAVPILSVRKTARAHGKSGAAITLVCEMEYDDGRDPRRAVRLAAYERAGFLKIDPRAVRYFQPDFRAPAEIDARAGAHPLPFQLLLRRVGREGQRTITGAEVQRIVRALYAMYGSQFRPQDMAHPALTLASYPSGETEIALVPPTHPA